jgi:hypothetical protein
LFAYSAREMGVVGRALLALFGLGAMLPTSIAGSIVMINIAAIVLGALLIGRDYLAVRKAAPGAAA